MATNKVFWNDLSALDNSHWTSYAIANLAFALYNHWRLYIDTSVTPFDQAALRSENKLAKTEERWPMSQTKVEQNME